MHSQSTSSPPYGHFSHGSGSLSSSLRLNSSTLHPTVFKFVCATVSPPGEYLTIIPCLSSPTTVPWHHPGPFHFTLTLDPFPNHSNTCGSNTVSYGRFLTFLGSFAGLIVIPHISMPCHSMLPSAPLIDTPGIPSPSGHDNPTTFPLHHAPFRFPTFSPAGAVHSTFTCSPILGIQWYFLLAVDTIG